MTEESPVTEPVEPAKDSDEVLGEPGLKALKAERERAAAAEKLASEREAKLKEYEDRDKSEEQKTLERIAAAEKRAEELELTANRATVAAATSVPIELLAGPKSGSQRDIQAFADALIAFKGQQQSLHIPNISKVPTGSTGVESDRAFADFLTGRTN